jgi:hypothetical protein
MLQKKQSMKLKRASKFKQSLLFSSASREAKRIRVPDDRTVERRVQEGQSKLKTKQETNRKTKQKAKQKTKEKSRGSNSKKKRIVGDISICPRVLVRLA